jgi:hypothetical protein
MIEDVAQIAFDARELAAAVRRNPMEVAAALDGLARTAELTNERTRKRTQPMSTTTTTPTPADALTYLERCCDAAAAHMHAHRSTRPMVGPSEKVPADFDDTLEAWQGEQSVRSRELTKYQQARNAAKAGTVEPRVAEIMANVTNPATDPLPDYLTSELAAQVRQFSDAQLSAPLGKKVTDAARDVIAAERTRRTGRVTSPRAPSSPAPAAARSAATPPAAVVPADPKARAAAEWKADATLRDSFVSEAVYTAYRVAELAGSVRMYTGRQAAGAPPRQPSSSSSAPVALDRDAARAQAAREWAADQSIRNSFTSEKVYVAARTAELTGRARIIAK